MFAFTRTVHQRFGIVIIAAVLLLGLASAAWCAEIDYDGTYAGTFTGDDSGYWVAVINSAGDSMFLSYSNSGDGDGGYVTYYNETLTVGNYYGWSEVFNSYIDAYIDSSDGSVTGDWSNATESGTFSGDAVNSISYAGSYSGSFAGDDTGSWSMTIASNGHITGTISPSSGGTYSFEGGCHPNGYIVAVGDSGGVAFAVFGQISGSSVTGGWESEDGYSGTISSSGSSGSSGGGGGSGCFIMSLIGE